MTPYEMIARKRDGDTLTAEQIQQFINKFVSGDIADYQMTAFLMAIYLRGMDFEETAALTGAYINSGVKVNLADIPGIKVDKHSTGGVGDKVSLVLAPLVASLGVPVPMMSGRGLGHSGGTLDKLESIPGFRTDQSLDRFRELLKSHGLALIGQTREFVPADKRIYALRDVTATVESIPLIAASIMSKKIAEGIDALVLDVKYGSGAFMKDAVQAETLAKTLIRIGTSFDIQIVACLTSMEQPLGNAIGNWLEVCESLDCLRGEGPADLREITLRLAAHMLVLGGVADTLGDGEKEAALALSDGRALHKFLEIVHAQGGDTAVLEHPEKYPRAKWVETLTAWETGFLGRINTLEIGIAGVELGAGRQRSEDMVDPQAGLLMHAKVGARLAKGDPILTLHTNREESVPAVKKRLRDAIIISDAMPDIPALILREIR